MFDLYLGSPDNSDRYQVGPRCVIGRDGDNESVGIPERLEDAEFWGVYRQRTDELWCWIQDFPSKDCAVEFVYELLELRRMGYSYVDALSIIRQELLGSVA